MALAALLALGVAPPAAAAPVTIGGITYAIDEVAGTAAVVNYSGGPVVVIPASITAGGGTYPVTSIGFQAFAYDGLTSVTIPEGVETIGGFAFRGNHLTSLTLPDSLRTIGAAAFYVNASLATVDLGNGVTRIESDAFFGTQIRSVTFPASLTYLGVGIFDYVDSATFLGPAPATNVNEYPLGISPANVSYYWRYGAAQVPGGFTPKWPNDWAYTTQAIAVVEYETGTGDTPPAPVEVAVGSPIAEPPQPTRPFHTFAGWFTDPTGGVAWDFDTASVSGDLTLHARWVADSHTVTLDAGTGEPAAAVAVDHGGVLAEPVAPTRTGYMFAGWFTAATGGAEWDFAADTVTADMTLHARWVIDMFTVTLDAGSGQAPTAVTVDHGQLMDVPVTPVRAGYTFVGWFTAADGGSAWDFRSDAVTDDMTLYAHWVTVPAMPTAAPDPVSSAPTTAAATANQLIATGGMPPSLMFAVLSVLVGLGLMRASARRA